VSDEVVLLDVADGIATVTLNRPGARNALSREVLRTLPRIVRECDERDDVRSVILTGADPAFCAGLDLKELGSNDRRGDDGGNDNMAEPPSDRRGPLPRIGKPIIGAVNGAAITGGFELALACDFLVASERARFADTHTRVGIQPGWGLTVLLREAVGIRRARELSTTGNFLDASTAMKWGLVNHVVPHEELLPYCRQLASDIASNDPAGVSRILDTYAEGSLVTDRDAWELEVRVSREWMAGGHGSAEEVARRREGVIARGRGQVR
jgi:enoyl-CoA hydratase